MKAIILAAGRGSRMKSLTQDKPKCLVQLAGRPLLQWQMEALRGAGITEIGVVRGYMSHALNGRGVKYFENPRWHETNMVMSLLCAEEWLKDDVCLISYADIVYTSNSVSKLIEAEGDIAITYDKNWLKLWRMRFEDPLSDAETFRTDSKGILLEIGGRAESIDEIEGQYMGLLKFSPSGWKQVKNVLNALSREECDRLDMTSLLGLLIKARALIHTAPIAERWFEVDSDKDIELYNSMAGNRTGGIFADDVTGKNT